MASGALSGVIRPIVERRRDGVGALGERDLTGAREGERWWGWAGGQGLLVWLRRWKMWRAIPGGELAERDRQDEQAHNEATLVNTFEALGQLDLVS